MNGEERRRAIAECLGAAPLSATCLAARFGVSRQVIVQDIALLRAEGAHIVATNRGYVAGGRPCSRVFKVRHTDEAIREELFLVVDAGGCVEDVFVRHKVYGRIAAPMGIDSRRKAEAFLAQIAAGVSAPLKHITGDYHYHTVSADSEAALDEIEAALGERGFLAEKNVGSLQKG